METNLYGAWRTALAFLPLLRRSPHPRIVNVSSGSGSLSDMGAGTVHEAASPHSSLLFLTIAAGVFVPLFVTYQVYGYWVFRGKVDVEQEATTA